MIQSKVGYLNRLFLPHKKCFRPNNDPSSLVKSCPGSCITRSKQIRISTQVLNRNSIIKSNLCISPSFLRTNRNKQLPMLRTVQIQHRSYSRAKSAAILLEELPHLITIIQEIWKTWEETEDNYEKSVHGKKLIKLYSELEHSLMATSPSAADFEHHAAVNGVPINENCSRLARIHAHRGEWEGAADHASKAAELNPSYENLLLLAEIYQKAGGNQQAVDTYSKILNSHNAMFKKSHETPVPVPRPEKYSTPLYAHLNLPEKLKYPESKLAEILHQRASCYFAMTDTQKAMADWMSVTKLDPNQRTAIAWARLARIAGIHGKWQQDLELCNKALEFDPESLQALEDRQTALLSLEKQEEAKPDFRKYSVLAHDRIWAISTHETLPDWGAEPDEELEEYDHPSQTMNHK